MRIDQIELSGSLFVTSSASIILGKTVEDAAKGMSKSQIEKFTKLVKEMMDSKNSAKKTLQK